MIRINRDKTRLQDIISAADDILSFLDESRDKRTILAIERSIEIIGEAARHLSGELKQHYPEIPWQDIVGMRNKLIHEYAKTNKDTVLAVAIHDIPILRKQINDIIIQMNKQIDLQQGENI